MGWDDLKSKPQNGNGAPDLHQGRRRKPSSATAGTSRTDRLPPHSEQAEQALLGCILLSPAVCLPEAIDKLPMGAEVFYDLRHQKVFKTAAQMFQAQKEVDLVTLAQELRDAKQLGNVGGAAYLSSLQDMAPSGAAMDSYIAIVLEKYFVRKAIQTCEGAASRLCDYEGDGRAELDALERDIMLLGMERTRTARKIKPMAELIDENIVTLEQRKAGEMTGVPTGLPDVDALTRGLQDAQFYVIGARPSVGKTAIVCNIADHAAVECNVPVAIFSLEMAAAQISMRFLSARARVNVRTVGDCFGDYERLAKAAGKLRAAPIYIDDDSGLNILQIRSRARRYKADYSVGLFILDYLQLVPQRDQRMHTEQHIADVSMSCKAMAKELRVPFLVAAQLNRDIDKRGKAAVPIVADLRSSGQIDQDADFIGLLYSPEERAEEIAHGVLPVRMIVAKHRNGPTGSIDFIFLKEHVRFESAAKIEPDDYADEAAQAKMPYAND